MLLDDVAEEERGQAGLSRHAGLELFRLSHLLFKLLFLEFRPLLLHRLLLFDFRDNLLNFLVVDLDFLEALRRQTLLPLLLGFLILQQTYVDGGFLRFLLGFRLIFLHLYQIITKFSLLFQLFPLLTLANSLAVSEISFRLVIARTEAGIVLPQLFINRCDVICLNYSEKSIKTLEAVREE